MIMLEEGEIDEEDLDLSTQNQPADSSLTTTTTTHINTNATKAANPSSPSLIQRLSPCSDHSSTQQQQRPNSKRKNRQQNKLNKRKKFDQNQNQNQNENTNNIAEDKDERFSFNKTTVSSASSSWGSPLSKPAPISLFDLFKTTAQAIDTDSPNYLNPVITEKENNKPVKVQKKPLLNLPHQQILSNDPDESEMTVSVESIANKMEKKRKYAEIQKDRQKREEEKQKQREVQQQQKREQIVCHFFLEGRCQKGDKCQFSHQTQKKYELCKFYLNGYCSKNDKCFFMHSEFPCKFYHKPGGQCLNTQCRFSHEPILNPLLKEAFEKFLNESDGCQPLVKPSLLGTPPPPPPPQPQAQPQAQLLISNEPGIPSLMNLPIKITNKIEKPPLSFGDVDERASACLLSGDVDLRSLNPNPVIKNDFERAKQELILKIMKAVSDNDSGIFSQVPKQALTDLLVKLVNTDSNDANNSMTTEAILHLLATLTAASTSTTNSVKQQEFEFDLNEKSILNESTSELQILTIDQDNDNEESNLNININYDEEEQEFDHDQDQDEIENNLVIEGNIGEFAYNLIEIDIEPSSLWVKPPTDMSSFNPNLDASDQESDPRIKYYSNRANCENVHNFQLKLIEQNAEQIKQEKQQLIPTPSSPPSSAQTQASPVYAEPVKQAIAKPTRVDPRLASRNAPNVNNQSPTRSISPPQDNKTDLISIQNRQLNSGSLLSSLPDVQFPKDMQQVQQRNISQSFNSSSYLNNDASLSNVNRLSIQDYKRKLKNPNSSSTSSLSSFSSNFSSSGVNYSSSSNNSSNQLQQHQQEYSNYSSTTATTTSSSLPTIPSYTINLQAPQSLHELLKSFQP